MTARFTRNRRLGRSTACFIASVAMLLAVVPAEGAEAPPPDRGSPHPLAVAVNQGSRNAGAAPGRINTGESCAEGGDGGYWHYGYEAPLPNNVLTNTAPIPGDLRLNLDLHSEHHQVRTNPEPLGANPSNPTAFLLGDATRVSMSNRRGTVRLGLQSGDCASPTFAFDGTTASGSGVWGIVGSSGAYRQAVGSGIFALTASVAPGADNPWDLKLNGNISVLQPKLKVEVTETYWGFLGAHYALRWVSVIYKVTNIGQGDAFDVRLTGATSPTPGVALIGPIDGNIARGPLPQKLGDLSAGESERVVLRWQLPLPAKNPPCQLVILGCEFDNTLTFQVPDALDDVTVQSGTAHAKAPNLPPPVAR